MMSMSTATNVDKSRKDLRVRLRPGSVQVLEFQMFMKRKTYHELFRTIKAHNSVGDPALSLSTQVDIDGHSCDEMDQAFPPCFASCKLWTVTKVWEQAQVYLWIHSLKVLHMYVMLYWLVALLYMDKQFITVIPLQLFPYCRWVCQGQGWCAQTDWRKGM